MRRIERMLSAAIAAALLLTGCALTPRSPSAADPRLVGTWQLADAKDAGGYLLFGTTYIDLTISEKNGSGGHSPCATYSANVAGTPGAVFITVRPEAHFYCPSGLLRNFDARYLAALRGARFANVTADSLTLTSPGATLSFLRTGRPALYTAIGTTWVLQEMPSFSKVIDQVNNAQTPITLRFDGVNTFNLSTPCGQYEYTYYVKSGILRIDTVDGGSYPKAPACAERVLALTKRLQNMLGAGLVVARKGEVLVVLSQYTYLTAVFGAHKA
ncbi:MAG: hypothetical protein JWR53_2023 [Glaciihabitans sp.]|nr:hypothetical protein [Glaciihabitans sp.]